MIFTQNEYNQTNDELQNVQGKYENWLKEESEMGGDKITTAQFCEEYSQKDFSMFLSPWVQFAECLRCGFPYVRMQCIPPTL